MEPRVPFPGKDSGLPVAGWAGKGGYSPGLHPSYGSGSPAFPLILCGADLPGLPAAVACRQFVGLFHKCHFLLHRIPCRLRCRPLPFQFLDASLQLLLLRVACIGNIKVVQRPADMAVGLYRGTGRIRRDGRPFRRGFRKCLRQAYRIPPFPVKQRDHLLERSPALFLLPRKLRLLVGVHLVSLHLPVSGEGMSVLNPPPCTASSRSFWVGE